MDIVNHPSHYQHNGKEAIDILEKELIKEEVIGYYKGNIYKYVFRAGKKGHKEDCLIDLDKAIWYAERLKTAFASEYMEV